MALLEKFLFIKESTIPNAGKGLFTNSFIPKGENIVQYKGKVTTWKEAQEKGADSLYIMYVTNKNVIDSNNYKKSFARYANDAKGLTKIKGLKNNGAYVHDEKGKVFIEALRDILPGEEIFVGYGQDYWDTIKHNMKIDAEEKSKKPLKKKKASSK